MLWGIAALVALMSVWIYSEPAMMFPGRSGGISLYANEGWRKYTTLVGPIATFGYWIGWSVVLAIFGNIIGALIQAQWFSSTNWDVYDGVVHLNLFNFIGIGGIIVVWLFNIFGVRPFAWFTYVTGALLMIPLVFLIFGPAIAGDWHSSQRPLGARQPPVGRRQDRAGVAVHHGLVGGWGRGLRDVHPRIQVQARQHDRAAQRRASFSLLVYILLPLGLGGFTGVPSSRRDPVLLAVRDRDEHDHRQGRDRFPAGLPDPLVPALDGELDRRRRDARCTGSRRPA